MSRPFARRLPSFAWYPVTTIASPILSVSLEIPRRISVFGVPPSIIHTSLVPSGFFTSMWSHACGFIHSVFLRVPSSFSGLSAVELR